AWVRGVPGGPGGGRARRVARDGDRRAPAGGLCRTRPHGAAAVLGLWRRPSPGCRTCGDRRAVAAGRAPLERSGESLAMGSHRSLTLIALSLLALPIRASTQTQLSAHQQQARDIFKQLIEINTTASSGSTTVAATAIAAR